jgi:pimeloyl-ACP methyl ester carboxylesterase
LNYDNGSLRLGSGNVDYRLDGQGRGHVVLLHGRNSHSGTWRKNFPALVERNLVFAPTLPTRQGTLSPGTIADYAECVAEAAGELGIPDAAVVGNSMGGWVAMRLALLYPRMFSRLVLEDTAGAESEEAGSLERASVPTMIVWGEHDSILGVGVGRQLHSRFSGSSFELVKGVGHVPHWERPEEFNRLLSACLNLRAR